MSALIVSSDVIARAIEANTESVKIGSIADRAAQNVAIREWADSRGYAANSKGRFPRELIAAAWNKTTKIIAPRIAILSDETSVSFPVTRGKLTLDAVANLLGVEVEDIQCVLVDGVPARLPRAAAPAPRAAGVHEVCLHDDDSVLEFVGDGRTNVVNIAEQLNVNPWQIKSINGREVIAEYRLATPRKRD